MNFLKSSFETKKIKSYCLLAAYAVLAMFVAWYNGYPLVEDDTGAYISHAFKLQLPADRTPFYGLFLGIASLHTTLWLTVFVQSLLLCYLIRRYIKIFFPDIDNTSEAICFMFIISFTCVSWIVSYLMPDVFTGILLLAVLLYLFEMPDRKMQGLIYFSIIALCIIIHNSHFLITAIFAFIFLIRAFLVKDSLQLQKTILLLGISVLFWAGMCSINYHKQHGFTFSRGSHVFMMGKFAENGILQLYLDNNCNKKQLKICAYKNEIPIHSWDFIWDPQSSLYKTGGWDSNKAEYNYIIHDIFTTPKYAKMFAEKSLISTFKELMLVDAPITATKLGKDSQPWRRINDFYKDELNEYCASLQNSSGYGAGLLNAVYYFFFIASSIWMLCIKRNLHMQILPKLYAAIILFLVINAFVTSTFSAVLNRYQNRVFWVLPATNFILIVRFYLLKYRRTISNHLS